MRKGRGGGVGGAHVCVGGVCVCVCVCMCAHRARVRACVREHARARMCVCVRACVRACIYSMSCVFDELTFMLSFCFVNTPLADEHTLVNMRKV